MPIDVIMPQMGESIAEGTLTVWLKKEGDRVERDENLFEISTDKVDAEIPSPAAGTLGEILVREGETVAVGTVVGRILVEGEVVDREADEPRRGEGGEPAAPPVTPPAPLAKAEAPPTPKAQADGATVTRGEPAAPEPRLDAAPPAAEVGADSGGDSPGDGAGRIPSKAELRRQRSSPLVRNIAAEHGIDLESVVGTGLSGRVTKRDILAHVGELDRAPSAAPAGGRETTPVAAAPAQPGPGITARPTPPPARPAPPGSEPPPGGAPPFAEGDPVEIVPMSVMRQRIAEHMTTSRRTSAHVTSFFEVDMSRVAELRERNKVRFQEDSGVKLTYMPFIISALVAGVKEWPILNASVWDDKIVFKRDINVGIAVAIPQERGFGLIVPVIRQADGLSLVGLARATNDLAERARTKKLSPEEVHGGTITITNPGVFGSLAGTPIINQPQVAILGVGAIEKRVKVVGPGDAIGVRTCAYFSISYDHRVVDGATADHFMGVLKDKLETFTDPSLKA
ncbi:MAG TPA: dihydrolipoamide acetyltransferase family protein [Gemmatimonadota bacterium]|nr:dihydrolipoamide acetyltransferase family protein [Gemmatimonadota bacterium]